MPKKSKKSITITLDLAMYNEVRKRADYLEKELGFKISDARIGEKLIRDGLLMEGEKKK